MPTSAQSGMGKDHTGKMLSQFLEVWEAVIETHTTAYPQACLVIRVSLAAMDCSSVVESGWSTANFLKDLHKTSTNSTLLDDLLITRLGDAGMPKGHAAQAEGGWDSDSAGSGSESSSGSARAGIWVRLRPIVLPQTDLTPRLNRKK